MKNPSMENDNRVDDTDENTELEAVSEEPTFENECSDSTPVNGNSESLEELIQSFRGYLLTMANRRIDPKLRVKMGASDVVQETLLAAHKNAQQFRGESREELLAWLKRILLRNLADARRTYHDAGKRQIVRERNLQGDSRVGMPPVDLLDDLATPGTHSVLREHASLLKEAILALPAEYREAVRLRNWERCSFEEIGKKMNRSTEAARKIWSRAVERLRMEIGGLDEPQ